jgi:hypothetical protein
MATVKTVRIKRDDFLSSCLSVAELVGVAGDPGANRKS